MATCKVPTADPIDPTIRIAVFDGGSPNVSLLAKYVRRIATPGVRANVVKNEEHGLAVTSAALFGPIRAGATLDTPYAVIDHYRVLDKDTEADPQLAMYPVLKRIVNVLERHQYDFVNLSVGPSSPIDDDDIHPWTAALDQILSSGKMFSCVAVGNDGDADATARLNRIQPPSDCVNAYASRLVQ